MARLPPWASVQSCASPAAPSSAAVVVKLTRAQANSPTQPTSNSPAAKPAHSGRRREAATCTAHLPSTVSDRSRQHSCHSENHATPGTAVDNHASACASTVCRYRLNRAGTPPSNPMNALTINASSEFSKRM